MAETEPAKVPARRPAGRGRTRKTAAPEKPSGQLIVFKAAGELFALALEHVREVTGAAPRRGIPQPPAPWVIGIASIRGELMPVVDLALRLGHAPSDADGQSLIIVGVGDESAVIGVEGVDRLVEVPPEELRPAPAYTGDAAEWIFEMDEHLVVVLKPAALVP